MYMNTVNTQFRVVMHKQIMLVLRTLIGYLR